MRLVILASGSGTLTQAVIDAVTGDQPVTDITIAAIGSDRPDAAVLDRARGAGIETFVVSPRDFASREEWNAALAEAVAAYQPDWVVSAGFMRILGPDFIARFPQRIINTHPALLPAFPGAHGVRDALDYGVKVTGSTIHLVDEGVDTGPIIAQRPVAVEPSDTEDSLHERIRAVERTLLVAVLRHLATGELQVAGRQVSGFPARDSID